ncbi:hypothetical protein QQA20_25210 [Vibrio parahaemolyticus]|uniref:hypothetical protein n=2 Tax=Vibrio parahaemolyticus TaxID=670 RepID=UPI00069141B9|nr:hypothetical protein [Vibrio parahaemolyticus]MBY4654327.1 hypothetical protein [Vibrio parahaemolyticus]MCR9855838.1 hypothetical protein [Vibrio parahaemolyticus]MDK9506352.1 hypothetical protein [Vibrio parahaemolyticus]MRE11695.1 hypothetical protein [Vibrio parahaemolyticus]NKJ89600.1 hypothetical protein [Vibrio parahaemolyticus]
MSEQSPDPLEQIMTTVVAGFKKTTDAIRELKDKQEALELQQKQQAKAAYHGMTGSGKSRYVAELVEIEKQKDPENTRGAQKRVADTLDISAPRVTQLLKSDKNRKNGK